MRFHARLLGGFALTDDQGRSLLPTTRKTRLLIARLLLAGAEPVPRSTLVEFCWGDRDVEQGRASLRQALYEARALTADPALLCVSKTAVRADMALLDSDLGQLIAAARGDKLAAVAEGIEHWHPLLSDCDGISGPIDTWLAAERRLHTGQVCAEIGAAITRALDRGRIQECAPLIAFLRMHAPHADVIEAYRREVASALEPSPAQKRAPGRALRVGVAVGCALVLIGVLDHRPSGAEASRVIAVKPLNAATADRPAQAVRSELSGDLVRALASNPARMQLDQLDGLGRISPDTAFLMSGDVATLGGRLEAHLQLSNARDGAILWASNFSRDAHDADALGEEIATKADAVINCALSTRHTGSATISNEASRLYLGACDLIEQYRLNEALEPLRQVTRVAPSFARAWADLATTEALTAADLEPADQAAAYRDAAQAAHRALALDASTGLAYYALAKTMPGIGNWRKRVATIARGLQVEPDGSELNNAMAWELLRVGRWREAIAYYRKSMAFDPLNPVKTASLIGPLAFDDQLDEADMLIDQASRTWPRNPFIWGQAFRVQMKVGDPGRASAMLDDPDRPEDREPAEVAQDRRWLRARADPTDANIAAALSTDLVRFQSGAGGGTDFLPLMLNMAELGRTESAYELASKMRGPADEDDDWMLFRNYLNRFRADPRFMTIAARRGLVSIWRETGRWPDSCIDHVVAYDCRAVAAAQLTNNAPVSGSRRL